MNQKVILGVVIVLLIGAVGYFAFVKKSEPIAQQSPTPTPTQTQKPVSPTPTPDKTADWKTYSSTKYGFEFKYPSNYSASQTVKTTWAPQIQSDYAKIQVNYNENFNTSDYEAYWQAHPGSKTLTVNGLQVIERPVGGNMDGESEYQFDFISKHYSILFLTKSAATQTQLSEFNQIISTFKFTK